MKLPLPTHLAHNIVGFYKDKLGSRIGKRSALTLSKLKLELFVLLCTQFVDAHALNITNIKAI